MKKKQPKKEVKKAKMNLEKLAIMVAGGFNEMHDKFDQVDKVLEKINQKLLEHDHRFDGIDQKINYINNRVDHFADHGRRITRLERKVGISD